MVKLLITSSLCVLKGSLLKGSLFKGSLFKGSLFKGSLFKGSLFFILSFIFCNIEYICSMDAI